MDLTVHWVGIAAIGVFVLAYPLAIADEFTQMRKSVPVIFGAGVIWVIIACITSEWITKLMLLEKPSKTFWSNSPNFSCSF